MGGVMAVEWGVSPEDAAKSVIHSSRWRQMHVSVNAEEVSYIGNLHPLNALEREQMERIMLESVPRVLGATHISSKEIIEIKLNNQWGPTVATIPMDDEVKDILKAAGLRWIMREEIRSAHSTIRLNGMSSYNYSSSNSGDISLYSPVPIGLVARAILNEPMKTVYGASSLLSHATHGSRDMYYYKTARYRCSLTAHHRSGAHLPDAKIAIRKGLPDRIRQFCRHDAREYWKKNASVARALWQE